jgi:hypothetical protein
MAALTGVMTADFTQFTTEIDRSVTKLQEFERAGAGTSTAISGFADSLGTADRLLGSVGVRISPQIAALRELGNVAGLTVSQLGAVGTASVTVGTAIAAWELGRAIAGWTNLDETIANATASLLGWGDVAAQRAGAGMDVLNRATQIAGRTITDFNVALQIIKKSNDDMSGALNNGAERWRQWTGEIAKLRDRGDLQAIDKELKDGTSTMKELAAQYGISERALQFYVNRTKESTAILEKWRATEQAGLEKVRKAQEELNQAGGGWRDTLLTIAPAAAATATAYLAMGESQSTIATAMRLSEVQVSALNKALQEQTRILQLNEPALGSLDSWMKTLAPAILEAGKSQQFFDQQLMASIATVEQAAVPAIEKLEETFRSVTTAIREETGGGSKNAPGSVAMNLGNIAFGTGGLETAYAAYSKRYSAAGVGAIGGGPAEDFLSWAMRAGYATKGTQVSNTFNIVDTESEIARRVSEEISRQIQRGSLVT